MKKIWQGFCVLSFGLLTACGPLTTVPGSTPSPVPIGQFGESFDAAMTSYMQANGIPGGALAIVKDRHLVYAKGYGWADVKNHVAATPSQLFRIASLSKTITAVAILKLVQDGRLSLDDHAFDLLGVPCTDPRLHTITIKQLLHHTAGWTDLNSVGADWGMAKLLGVPVPVSAQDVVRAIATQPLAYDPGTQYHYTTVDYILLGRVIEHVTGEPYETYVRQAILAPMGITDMHIGNSQASGPDEVTYYDSTNLLAPSVFAASDDVKVPDVYGGYNLAGFDAGGGWVASAVDLARYAATLDDPARSPLNAQTTQIMYSPPDPPVARNPDGSVQSGYYGCGWMVDLVGHGVAHTGTLLGERAFLVRRANGIDFVMLFNQSADDAIWTTMTHVTEGVTAWPDIDLFQATSDATPDLTPVATP